MVTAQVTQHTGLTIFPADGQEGEKRMPCEPHALCTPDVLDRHLIIGINRTSLLTHARLVESPLSMHGSSYDALVGMH